MDGDRWRLRVFVYDNHARKRTQRLGPSSPTRQDLQDTIVDPASVFPFRSVPDLIDELVIARARGLEHVGEHPCSGDRDLAKIRRRAVAVHGGKFGN
jgi:hypothetical protein